MNIYSKNEKKVEYLELIYDLIFVYMVSRDNALLGNIHGGFVDWHTFLMYTFCTLSIIQIWSFTTFYINMFGKNGIRDHIFLLFNMYLMYFIGEGIQMNAVNYIAQFHIAWGLILVNIGVQYLIELKNHRADVWNRGIIKSMCLVLFCEAVPVFVAAFLPAVPATVLSFAAILLGIIMTAISKKANIGGQVDFAHLSERAMLYVVFTFGEMVIAVAGYFTGGGKVDGSEFYYSFMTFMVSVGLFLSYEVVYNYLVNREGRYNGLTYMLIHILIIFSMNNITVSFEFMREGEIALMPKVVMLSVSLAAYFLFLLMLGGHFKKRCRINLKFILKMSTLTAAFIVLMILLRQNTAVNLAVSVAYVFAVYFVFLGIKKYQTAQQNTAAEN